MFCRGFAYLAGIYLNFTIRFSGSQQTQEPKKLCVYISVSFILCDLFFLRNASFFMSLDHSFYVSAEVAAEIVFI